MRSLSTKDLTLAAMVAALYAVMSYFGNVFGLTFGPIQFRFAEALTVLPFLFPCSVPGLFVGCLIANLLSPYGLLDVAVGALATLLAAAWTGRLKHKWLAPVPPVICNTVLVGFTIAFSETGLTSALPAAWVYNGLSVGVGELGACYALGMLLLYVMPRVKFFRTMIPEGRLSAV